MRRFHVAQEERFGSSDRTDELFPFGATFFEKEGRRARRRKPLLKAHLQCNIKMLWRLIEPEQKMPKTNKESANENLLNLPFGSKITSGPSKLFLWGLALPFRIPFASVCGNFWSLASAGGLRVVAFHSSSPRRVIAPT